MASVGRGKAKFREYSKIVNQLYRQLVDDIKEGEEYYSNEIEFQFNQVYLAFEKELIDEDIPNQDLWRKRLSQHITKQITRIFDKFSELEEEEEEEEEKSDETFIDKSRGVIVINGDEYPIIDRGNAPTMRRNGRKPRNRVFTSLAEVESYLYDTDWPREYIYQYGGIEIIYRNGTIVGFRIWIG